MDDFLGLMGFNENTGSTGWICYSHSSYYAEVPDAKKEWEEREKFIQIWGMPNSNKHNPSSPKLVKPMNSKEPGGHDENPF
ncbi:hypothetical protein ACNGTP_03500 [Bisgaard Taxon 45]